MARYKLKLKRLDFVSPVDQPAQETAKVLLMKRKGGEIERAFAEVKKLSDELGLVFCWAFTSKAAGEDYYDLHGDNIDPDFIKVCAEFMEGARAVDTMHDGVQKGGVTFGMPMTPEIAKAFFGIDVDTIGFMVAIKPSAEDYAKFKSGEYTGVSIAGIGEREQLTAKRAEDLVPLVKAWLSSEDGAAFIRHVIASGGNSTTAKPIPTFKTVKENLMPTIEELIAKNTDLETKHTALTKGLLVLEQKSTLTDAARAHLATLTGADADAFLAKSVNERAAIVDAISKAAEATNAVVYTSKSDGAIYRAKDDPRLVEMAKREDLRNEELTKSREAIEKGEFEKKALATIPLFTKSVDVGTYIMRSVVKGGGDQKTVDDAVAALKGANGALEILGKMQGTLVDDVKGGNDPKSVFDAELAKFAKGVNKTPAAATSDFIRTQQGADLYADAYPTLG